MLPSQGFLLMLPAFTVHMFRGFTNPLLALVPVVVLILLVVGGLHWNPSIRLRKLRSSLLPVLAGVGIAVVNLVIFYY